ncbi:hypothetical protein [Nocardia fluminea]|uniref:Uncharacterized protein n=1 Tax=Nocardia fluminea TaxID=134984 RepID=A0A2N3VGX3_9NOCA|nr:hypothetical protein [Nocardia fluminea]PKV80854.1 hypothetical protein ATK86_5291 [Nocardia fluminea]
MQHLMQFVDRTFGRLPRHAARFGSALTVKAIRARLADEEGTAEKLAAYAESVARQAAVTAAMYAPTLTLPIVDVEVIDAELVDPDTLPLRRAELFAITDGRPAHELDFALAGVR